MKLANICSCALGLGVLISAPQASAELSKPVESVVNGMHVVDRMIVLQVGGSEIVALPPNVQSASTSVPDVLSINLVSHQVAEIMARKEGRTDVLFSGRDTIYRYHVTVQHPQH